MWRIKGRDFELWRSAGATELYQFQIKLRNVAFIFIKSVIIIGYFPHASLDVDIHSWWSSLQLGDQ